MVDELRVPSEWSLMRSGEVVVLVLDVLLRLDGLGLAGGAKSVNEAEDVDILSGLRRLEGVTGGLNSWGGTEGE